MQTFLLIIYSFFLCPNFNISPIEIEFEKKYYFIPYGMDLSYYTLEYTNTIVFHENGMYTREEDTAQRNPKIDNYNCTIKITNLQGEWKIIGGALELKDNVIKTFDCYQSDRTPVDCNLNVADIKLGKGEILNQATICIMEQNIIQYKQDISLN